MPNPIANIYLDRLLSNFRFIYEKFGYKNIFAVVKANAYGHGIENVVKTLENSNVHGYCVSSEDEIIQVLNTGTQKPILMLGRFDKRKAELLVNRQIRLSLHIIEDIKWYNDMAKKLNTTFNIHLKVDTGMSRLGMKPGDIDEVIHYIKESEFVNVEGIWTHFSSADSNTEETLNQIKTFNNFLSSLKKEGINPSYIHAANSAAILKFPDSYFNCLRPGLLLYGVSPLLKVLPELKPVMEFSAPMVLTKSVEKGISVGYNRVFKTDKSTTIGTIQVGYADGIPTCMNNNGNVLIGNKKYPICGKISMDLTTIDLGDDYNLESQNCILWGSHPLQIENLAKKYKLLPYEFLILLSSRVKRNYLGKNLKIKE